MALLMHVWVTTGPKEKHTLGIVEVVRREADTVDEPMEYDVRLHTQQMGPELIGQVLHVREDGWKHLSAAAMELLAFGRENQDEAKGGR
jgi:hypothetical protein